MARKTTTAIAICVLSIVSQSQALSQSCDSIGCDGLPPRYQMPIDGSTELESMDQIMTNYPIVDGSGSTVASSADQFAGAAARIASAPDTFAPNLIGDTSAGGCGGLTFDGDNVRAVIDHPIYACSRLNIAENNSAIASDRAYINYRHYHNASEVDFFSDDGGPARSYNTDLLVLGVEKLLTENISVEVRLPITTQLGSDLFIFSRSAATDDTLLNNRRDTELGNVAVILKAMLLRSSRSTLSAGLGINTPTAEDLRIRFDVERNLGGVDYDLDADGTYFNETVNLQPFLAFVHRPNNRFFGQGFLQFDIPVNESEGVLDLRLVEGNNLLEDFTDERDDLALQSLVRVNLGVGAWLGKCQKSRCNSVRHAALFEAHYTGTLEDPERLDFDLGGSRDIEVNIGPLVNSTNSVNLVAGVASFIGRTSIYNGFSAPIRDGSDRGFDFEYSLLVNRSF